MTLEERRERGDLIEVFKILKGLTKIDPKEFWEVREARNGARLVKELASNGRRQRSILLIQGRPEMEPSARGAQNGTVLGRF